jgi:hypothetical protein
VVFEYCCAKHCCRTTFLVCEIVRMIILNLYNHCLVLVLFCQEFCSIEC